MSVAEPHAARLAFGRGRYEVVAVRYGTLTARKSQLFHRYEAYGEPDAEVEMAYYFWVLRAGGETILVDTGFDPAAGARRGRTCLCPPLEALSASASSPSRSRRSSSRTCTTTTSETSTRFRTRRWWCRAGSSSSGPGRPARFQFASHVEAREVALLDEASRAGRVRLTEGVEEIFDGITARSVGGHSPGQQVTVVSALGGDVVLAPTPCTSTRSSSSIGRSP